MLLHLLVLLQIFKLDVKIYLFRIFKKELIALVIKEQKNNYISKLMVTTSPLNVKSFLATLLNALGSISIGLLS
ncbi:MAG: hypothetical protein K940chlam5_00268 [Candidatus Anoxychlamydiales bacterium]|nr:hypothetical protein [Candidatus Anoxychlamydiales bacterium]